MIEVFKVIHNYYDTGSSVKLNFNPVGSTRGNKFKLRKNMCRYDIRKYSVCYWVVNVWNSLPDYVVDVDSVNSFKFKSRLDKYWANQEVVVKFNSELTRTGGLPVCMYLLLEDDGLCRPNGIKCMVCRYRHRGYTRVRLHSLSCLVL